MRSLDYKSMMLTNGWHDGQAVPGLTPTRHAGIAYKTLGKEKRTVFGGGGITPDIFVGFDTSTLSRNITSLYVDGTLSRFIYTWYTQHLPVFQAFKSQADDISGFHDDEHLWNALITYAEKDTVNLRHISAKDKEVLQHRIKALIARQIWRTEGYYEVSNAYDPVVAKALQVLNK